MKAHQTAFLSFFAIVWAANSFAQKTPDRAPAKDNSVAAEMASFDVHEDFEVSLFADEKLGIANPIAIQWDHRGRLWVLCTLAYAQLKPAEIPNDKLIILEDTDGDGRADKTTVFADGLEMPTGFALGHEGVYLAEGPDFIHLKDTTGDDKADTRKLILTGFGTGDTHQNISNFTFDSGGFLYFSQGLHAFSQVETPWGVSRGDHAGFWRFDPRTTKLDPFCFSGMVGDNPCGIALDRWGALFMKSNAPHLCFATPGLIPTTHKQKLMQLAMIGQTPGKSMGAEIVETAHLPDWLQNNALISGYFARQVMALPLVEKGAGFEIVQPVKIISAEHQSFRPVDVRVGPEGAIYVVDWFNPIINHYQVSLRHPHRDYDHGRIWRLTAKKRPLVKSPLSAETTTEALFEMLRSPERWTRELARRKLSDADPAAITEKLTKWALALNPALEKDSLALVEAVGVLESHRVVEPTLLDHLEASTTPHARAVVARMIARAADPIPDANARLTHLLRDPHPRPRLEAVIACSNIPAPESLKLALTALDSEVDKNINYSLEQTVHALAEHWLPALENGTLSFEKPDHLAFALETYGGETSAVIARKMLKSKALPATTRQACLRVLATAGKAVDITLVLNQTHENATLLNTLVRSWQTRRVKPTPPFQPQLSKLLNSKKPSIRYTAVQLAGLWRATDLAGPIEKIAFDPAAPPSLRAPALNSLASLRGKAAVPKIKTLALAKGTPATLQQAAIKALVSADIKAATAAALHLIQAAPKDTDLMPILNPILSNGTGPAALAAAISEIDLKPEIAQQIVSVLSRLGRSDAKLSTILSRSLGVQAGAPKYDAAKVAAIVAAVQSGKGNAKKGKAVFELPQITCVACHQIDKKGGILGPPLDAVGAGLPLDQIVESVLWPARQLKEGYFATAITTVDEQVHTGYIDNEDRKAGVVWLRDSATQKVKPVSMHQIIKRDPVGTLMSPGLTNSLTPEQFNDLIAYLASLKG